MSRKQLNVEERKIIIDLYEKQHKSYGEIGKIVSRKNSTVRKFIQRKIKENRIENKAVSGRPPKLSEKDKRYIKRLIEKNPFTTATKIASELETYHRKKVSPESVRRCLKNQGLKARVPRKKTLINKVNRQKRMDFAKTYLNKAQEFWDQVSFTDESKYNIFGWPVKIVALDPKNTIKTVKHGVLWCGVVCLRRELETLYLLKMFI